MAKYLSGPSTLWLTGRSDPVLPGTAFEHDFSVDGPEGEHGPDREAALLAAGALTRDAHPDLPPADAALSGSPEANVAPAPNGPKE